MFCDVFSAFSPTSCDLFSAFTNSVIEPALLCTVYAAVQDLCANPLALPSPLECAMPFKKGNYKALHSGMSVFKTPDGNVVKLFDTEGTRFSPNDDLMSCVD